MGRRNKKKCDNGVRGRTQKGRERSKRAILMLNSLSGDDNFTTECFVCFLVIHLFLPNSQ
jgi:hypothetical protein